MKHNDSSPNDRGAVLITVLLMVALTSVIAVGLSGRVSALIARQHLIETSSAAREAALSAETLAKAVLRQSFALNNNRTTLDAPWAQPAHFMTEAGRIDGRISDGGNCFNLNSLVTGEGAIRQSNPAAQAEFARLMAILGLNPAEAEAIAAATADWVDGDTRPNPRGAEDYDYMAAGVPHRTGNTLMADVSEFRAVKGVTSAVYGLLRPYLCALPVIDPAPLNVNTLMPAAAPVVAALFPTDPDLGRIMDAIAMRPAAGYGAPEEFWRLPAFRGVTVPDEIKARTGVRSRFFNLVAAVSHADARITLTALFDATGKDDVRLVSRRFGDEE